MASNAATGGTSPEAAPGQNRASETTPLLGRSAAADEEAQVSDAVPEAARSRRSKLRDRCAAIGVYRIVAVLLVIAFIIVAALWYKMSSSHSQALLCLSPACIHAASGYLTNLSPNYKAIDPCNDFEEYVCGGWQESHDMRADQGMVDALGLMNDEVLSTIRNILEGEYPDKSNHSSFSPQNLRVTLAPADRQNFDEMQKAYNACMDVDAITSEGFAPILELLQGLSKTFSKPGDYSDTILFLEKSGALAFFEFYVRDDDKTPENQVIYVSPAGSIGLPSKSYFEDKDIVAKYEDAMTKVFKAIPDIKSPAKAAAAVVELESKITAASPDKTDLFDVTKSYNVMAIKDTVELFPQLDLESILKTLAPSDYKLETTITSFPDALANISSIVESTPAEVVQNFFAWRLVSSHSSAVLGAEIKPYQQFQNVLQGKDPDALPERWRTCVSHVGSAVGWTLSRFYVEVAFSAAAKDFGNQIISDIKSAYLRNFANLDWMDDEVKEVAAEKVNNIDQKVGYPTASPNIMDPEELRSYYKDLLLTDSFFHNIVAAASFNGDREWSSLGKPTDMNKWEMTAATVNAYYNPSHNEIVFPAAIMQFPFFSVDLPSYISYGAFGAIAGHELSHGFDNNGRHYDVHGKYDNWWTNSTIEAFTEKAQCIVEEFNNFTVIGKDGPIHINGRQTLGENIADSGGLTAAWSAWHARRKADSARELSLPGLDDFTHEQLFYVSYANAWCSKFRPAMLTNRVSTDEHSPDPVRIKGTVLNSRGFREAFNCPVKEPTCELW